MKLIACLIKKFIVSSIFWTLKEYSPFYIAYWGTFGPLGWASRESNKGWALRVKCSAR